MKPTDEPEPWKDHFRHTGRTTRHILTAVLYADRGYSVVFVAKHAHDSLRLIKQIIAVTELMRIPRKGGAALGMQMQIGPGTVTVTVPAALTLKLTGRDDQVLIIDNGLNLPDIRMVQEIAGAIHPR